MCYVRSRKKNIKRRVLICALSVVLLIFISLRIINLKLDPLVCDVAEEQIKNNIASLISSTINEYTFENEFIDVKYENGKISSITTNTAMLNNFKAMIVSKISEVLAGVEEYKIEVSYANLFDEEILFGNATALTVSAGVLPIYSVAGDIRSELNSAGINQTHYSVFLSINVDVNAVLLISTVEISTEYEICLADAVIVGEVPEFFFTDGTLRSYQTEE